MKRFHFLFPNGAPGLTLFLLWALVFAGCGRGPREDDFRAGPAIQRALLITVDGLAPEHVELLDAKVRGRLGFGFLDRGVSFSRCATPIPQSRPAHASLLLGQEPHEHGVLSSWVAVDPSGGQGLVERLKEAGFFTFGVIGRESLKRASGLDAGFTSFDDQIPNGPPRVTLERSRRGAVVGKIADRMVRALVERSFFGWIHFSDLLAREVAGAGESGFEESLEAVSSGMCLVLETLQQAGVLDTTLVVITSAHSHSKSGSSLTDSLFLEPAALEIPLIVAFAVGLPWGRVVDHPVTLLDVAPTLSRILLEPGGSAFSEESMDLITLAFDVGRPIPDREIWAVSTAAFNELGFSPLVCLSKGDTRVIASDTHWAIRRLVVSGEITVGRGSFEDLARVTDSDHRELLRAVRVRLRALAAVVRQSKGSADELQSALPDPNQAEGVVRGLCEARRLLEADLPDEAEQRLARVRTLAGSESLAACDLVRGQIFLVRGDFSGARKSVASALGSLEQMWPPWVDALWLEARLAEATGDLQRVTNLVPIAREAVARNPRVGRLFAWLGHVLRSAERLDEAERFLVDASAVFPAVWQVWFELGVVREKKQDVGGAIEAWRFAIRADIGARDPRVALGRLFVVSGRFAEAVEQLVTASRFRGVDPELAFDCGRAFEGVGSADSALEAYRVSRQFGIRADASSWRIGVLLASQGRREEAVAELEDLAARGPGFDHGLRSLIGLLVDVERFDGALSRLEELFERSPDDPWGLLMKSRVLVAQKLEKAAVRVLDRANEVSPDDPEILNDLAWLLLRASDSEVRDPQRAVRLARRAASVSPENLDVKDTLVRALLDVREWTEGRPLLLGLVSELGKAGRAGEALGLLESAIEAMEPADPELSRLLEVYRKEVELGLGPGRQE